MYNQTVMNEQNAALTKICLNHNVSMLYTFGSRAQAVRAWVAEETAALPPIDSDIDIGIKFLPDKTISIQDKVNLTLTLEDFFKVDRVDLVNLTEADPFLAANIIRGERLYVLDSHQADEYELYILRRAGDLAPLERERMALILKDSA